MFRLTIFILAITMLSCISDLGFSQNDNQTLKVSPEGQGKFIDHLIPLPKEIRLDGEKHIHPKNIIINTSDHAGKIEKQAVSELLELLHRAEESGKNDIAFSIIFSLLDAKNVSSEAHSSIFKRLTNLPNNSQAYIITHTNNAIEISALDEKGLYYGAQTLKQLIEPFIKKDIVTIPLLEVIDWPDMAERGLWNVGVETPGFISWLSGLKLNFSHLLCAIDLTPGKDRCPPLPLDMINRAKNHAFQLMPHCPHYDFWLETNKRYYPKDLIGSGAFAQNPLTRKNPAYHTTARVPCATNPLLRKYIAEWIADVAKLGVREMSLWLSEYQPSYCSCEKCMTDGKPRQLSLETKATIQALQEAKKLYPDLIGRVFLTIYDYQDTIECLALIDGEKNAKVEAAYGMNKAFDTYAASGKWVADYKGAGVLGTAWSSRGQFQLRFSPGPNEIINIVQEHARKKYSGLYTCSSIEWPMETKGYVEKKLCDYHILMLAEWSWNAKGRTIDQFNKAWIARQGYADKEQALAWLNTTLPIESFIRDALSNLDLMIKSLEEGKLIDSKAAFGIENRNVVEQFGRLTDSADKNARIARQLNAIDLLAESDYLRDALKMLRDVYLLSSISAGNVSDKSVSRDQIIENIHGAINKMINATERKIAAWRDIPEEIKKQLTTRTTEYWNSKYQKIAKTLKPAIKVDGKLDEPFWKSIKSNDNFNIVPKNGKRSNNTEFKLTNDEKWLYLGIDCKNPDMNAITPNVAGHDRGACKDDSIELFLDPGTDGKLYFHYTLSFANARDDQRVHNGVKENEWDYPWLSETRRRDDGWSAEIAIPLSLIAAYGSLDKVRLNIARNLRTPVYDQCAVHVDDRYEYSSWTPVVSSFHEIEKAGEITALKGLKIKNPDLAEFDSLEVFPYYNEGDKKFYNISFRLKNLGPIAADFEIIVIDTPKNEISRVVARKITLRGRDIKNVSLSVPVATISARDVRVILKNRDEQKLQEMTISDPKTLRIMSAYLDRNYYTNEDNAIAVCALGMPERDLNAMEIAVKTTNGDTLAAQSGLSSESFIGIPLKALPIGENALSLELRKKGEKKTFCGANVSLLKRAPHPGREWKVDRVNRVILNNGNPFFPFGPVAEGTTSDKEWHFKLIKDLGFNTALFWAWHPKPEFKEAVKFQEMAAKYGLYTVAHPELFAPNVDMKTYEKYFTKAKFNSLKTDNFLRRSLLALKSNIVNDADFKVLDKPKKNEIYQELYDKTIPEITRSVESGKNADNLIGYFIFDEPVGTEYFDQYLFGRDFYKQINRQDGYHPVMTNFSGVPDYSEKMYDWYDIQMNDPYWVPCGDYRNSINHVTIQTAKAVKNTSFKRQIVWVVLVTEWWSGQRKRVITPQEQRCQTYLAIINGAKGIFYYTTPQTDAMRECFKQLNRQLATLAPAIVAPEVKQEIRYFREIADKQRKATVSEITFAPEKNLIPEVLVRAVNDSEGFILMAANNRYFPVEATYTVAGVAGSAREMFRDQHFDAVNQSFSDKLEGYGVRAYRLNLLKDIPIPLKITVTVRYCPEELPPPEKGYPHSCRADKKNEFPNPSFETATIKGWPDYFWPSPRQLPGEGHGLGGPTSGWRLCEENPYHGKYCLRVDKNRKTGDNDHLHICCAPQNDKPTPYTFSAYLRGSRDGMSVRFAAAGFEGSPVLPNIEVGKEWKRYWISGVMPAKTNPYTLFSLYLLENDGVIWADAFQLEKGASPTAFED